MGQGQMCEIHVILSPLFRLSMVRIKVEEKIILSCAKLKRAQNLVFIGLKHRNQVVCPDATLFVPFEQHSMGHVSVDGSYVHVFLKGCSIYMSKRLRRYIHIKNIVLQYTFTF